MSQQYQKQKQKWKQQGRDEMRKEVEKLIDEIYKCKKNRLITSFIIELKSKLKDKEKK